MELFDDLSGSGDGIVSVYKGSIDINNKSCVVLHSRWVKHFVVFDIVISAEIIVKILTRKLWHIFHGRSDKFNSISDDHSLVGWDIIISHISIKENSNAKDNDVSTLPQSLTWRWDAQPRLYRMPWIWTHLLSLPGGSSKPYGGTSQDSCA